MSEQIEAIGKRDVIWSYVATIITVGAGVILLPFILHKMSAETVGIWNIFQTVTYLTMILDFGFRPSFSRSVSFIYSGARSFQREGVERTTETTVDYGLLRTTIHVMQRLYRYLAAGTFVLLATAGTAYMVYILRGYTGDQSDALIAWVMLIGINSFNLYTFYYDALLQGKGYIRRIQQINIVAQLLYLTTAIILIEAGLGLTAIVSAQILNVLTKRVLAYRVFYTKELKEKLSKASGGNESEVFGAIWPNAIRSGLTGLGGFLVNHSALILGGLFLSLSDLAAYGITLQCMDILARCASVPYQSYIPKIAEARARKDYDALGQYYRYNVLSVVGLYVIGGAGWLLLGNEVLAVIGSQTSFVGPTMLVAMLVISLLETNHSTAAGFIQADNRIPFFIPSLASGAATLVLMGLMIGLWGMGIWGMILAPGIAQICYQNWKWPLEVIQEIRERK